MRRLARGLFVFATLPMVVACGGQTNGTLAPISRLSNQAMLANVHPGAAHKIYVVNNATNTLTTYLPDGTQTTPTITGLNGPRGVAVDKNGKIYIASFVPNQPSSYTVTTFTPDGQPTTPTITEGLCGPDSVAIDAHLRIWIVSVCGGVSIFKPDGTFVKQITKGLDGPQALTIDANGKAYVTNYSSSQVSSLTTYDASGKQTKPTITKGLNWPEGVAVDGSGNVYVSNFLGNNVTSYLASGKQRALTISANLNGPEGLAFSAGDKDLYVANINGADVTTYRLTNGDPVSPTITGLSTPIGIAVR